MGIEGKMSSVPTVQSQEDGYESLEKEGHDRRAVILVPGLTEGPAIFDVLGKRMREEQQEKGFDEKGAALETARLYVVSTHDDYASLEQQAISSEVAQKDIDAKNAKEPSFLKKLLWGPKKEEVTPERSPIMCVVSDSETHHNSFENRISLTEKALTEAVTDKTEEVVLIGHSAGGAAVLAAVANEVTRRNTLPENERSTLPDIKAVLVAPAVPGDVGKLVLSVAWTFIGVVFKDLFKKALSGRFSESYVKHLLAKEDITASNADLEKILGPFGDEDFKKKVLDGAVPLAGGEGLDLLKYPKVLRDLKPGDWPENVTVDVIVPKSDKWVSAKGQAKLVDEVLARLTDAKKWSMPGGHLPLGSDSYVSKLIADITMS